MKRFLRIGQACWSNSNNTMRLMLTYSTPIYTYDRTFLYIFQLNFRVLMRIWRKFLTTWAIIVAESSSESTHQHFKLHKMRSEINEFRLTPNHQLVIVSLNLPAYHFTIHTIFNPLVVLAGALSNPLTIISVNFESLSNKKHFLISGRLNNH